MPRMPEVVEIDPITGPGAEGARRATGGPGPVTGSRASDPDPEVPAKVERRRFPPAYRLRILKEVDACKRPRRGGRPAASRGVVLVALDELAAAARGGRPAGNARAPPGPDATPRRPAGETARGREPPAAAEAAAGGDNHHAPKKVAEILGIPLKPSTSTRPTDARHRSRHDTRRGRRALCHSVGLARASFYRRRRPTPSLPPPPSRAPSPRALAADERQAMLATLHSERFVDQSPAEVHATLLEEQTYLGSVRTMYRVLAEAHEVRERRAQARHPVYTKPELVATGPNQIWSWDITKLKGPIPYLYYSLYVILDLFSRYVVGWMVARHENAHLAERLIAATCLKQGIAPQQLTIHADRGAPMRSKLVALLFSDLSINASHSRPRVSNDNPFSESQFRTLKYRPEFPDRFGSLEHARGVSRDLFAWYNNAHHHSGLSYLTPADVHYGRAATVLAVRHRTRLAAYAAHPERFVQGPPRPETLPTAAWINRPPKPTREDAQGATIVTPDDPQHGVISRSQPISADRSITLVASMGSLQ